MNKQPLKEWRQAIVDIDEQYAEAFSAILMEEGASGLEIIDDQSRAMLGRAASITHRVTLVAPYEPEEGLEVRISKSLSELVENIGQDCGLELSFCTIEEEDWNAKFKAQWTSFALTKSSSVVPSWETKDTWPNSEHLIFIDPGVAFGTGEHQTTQLCAEALEEILNQRKFKSLLDIGTGSGILSILALQKGVQKAVGTENDPMALNAAVENLQRNQLDDRFTAMLCNPDQIEQKFPLIVANILAPVLMMLAPQIAQVSEKNSCLLLSGLLKNQKNGVLSLYQQVGFKLIKESSKDDWLCLELIFVGL